MAALVDHEMIQTPMDFQIVTIVCTGTLEPAVMAKVDPVPPLTSGQDFPTGTAGMED